MSSKFYKKNPDDKVMWVDYPQSFGNMEFSFDGKKIYNLFQDYPEKLTAEEKAIFDEENPRWAEFFVER